MEEKEVRYIVDVQTFDELLDCFGLFVEVSGWLSQSPSLVESQEIRKKLDLAISKLHELIDAILVGNFPKLEEYIAIYQEGLKVIQERLARGEITGKDAAQLRDEFFQNWRQWSEQEYAKKKMQ